MLIRKADSPDIPGLVKVHIDTWKTTYRGIVSDQYLDSRSPEKSAEVWKQLLSDQSCFTFLAETDGDGIIGFVHCGPERENNPIYHGEIRALYVMKGSQKSGTGKQLVEAAMRQFVSDGINTMLVWVLENNPSRGFYERMGGCELRSQMLDIGGIEYVEVSYGWDDLKGMLAKIIGA